MSAATFWELAIKRAHGKADIDLEAMADRLHDDGFADLPVTRKHGLLAGALPRLHHDPFDRMLLAQARIENARLLTADHKLRWYSSVVEFF